MLRYDELLAAEEPGFEWPELDERAPASMCYTSGTTGDPEGRRLFAPLDVPARAGRAVGAHHRRIRGRPHPGHRADVPRQRVGHPVRRVPRRCALHMPGPYLDPGTTDASSSPPSAPPSRRPCRRSGARSCSTANEHDIDLSSIRMGTSGGAAAPRSRCSRRSRSSYGAAHHPGLGDDRDLAGGRHGSPSAGVELGHVRRDGLADEVRPHRGRGRDAHRR